MPLQRLRTIIVVVALLAGSAMPLYVLAQTAGDPFGDGTFANPLGKGVTIYDVLTRIAQFLLSLVGFIAIIALIWGGVLYIAALGQEKYIEQAKRIIVWAIIGLAIAILAFSIMQLVQSILTTGRPT